MPLPSLSTNSVQTFSDIKIWVAGADMSQKYVLWQRTSFELAAYAEPGTFNIALRDENQELDFHGGEFVKCEIDGNPVFQGPVMQVGRGTLFPDSQGFQERGRLWTLAGVDRNTHLDKLFIYNHDNPATFPDGGGAFPKGKIPFGTTNKQYLNGVFADSDINLINPPINTNRRVADLGPIPFLDPRTDPLHLKNLQFMQAGSSLRAAIQDLAGFYSAYVPGASMVFYIDQGGFFVFQPQDNIVAPFSVSDDPDTFGDVGIRALQHTSDISSIKNDVLMFETDLNPSPDSKQNTFLYRHNTLTASIAKYGRFQYASNVQGFTPQMLTAQSGKILFQEGTPGESAEFDCQRGGLYPGQIITVNSTPWGYSKNLPIRRIGISFASPNLAVYHVTCAFDTLDPWGLISALKRPATRGMVPPRFSVVSLSPGQQAPAVDAYSFVNEQPKSLGGGLYQCAYAYIRYSIAVHAGGLRHISTATLGGSQLNFVETDPDKGQFRLAEGAPGTVYASYHVAFNLTN